MNENQLQDHVADNAGTTLAVIASNIDHTEDYPNLPIFLVKEKFFTSVSKAEKFINQAKEASLIKSILGGNPKTTGDFIGLFTEANEFQLDANNREPMTWTWGAKKGERVLFDESALVRELLNLNRNLLGNRFRKNDVEDEVSYFVQDQKIELANLMREAITDPKKAATVTDETWMTLVQTIFEDTNISFELSKCVLQEFIYQVKRRLFGLPVSHHLMPVIYGGQGSGKSEFTNRLVGVLGNLYAVSNFAEIADNRNASLFQNFVIVMDEMGKADRSDIETVKSAITRDKFTYRPMGSNQDRTLIQNSIFIGSSNKTLAEIIKDPTGNRRFVQLDMKVGSGQAEWDFVNSTDFLALWSSIDHKGKRPMDGREDELRAAQSAHHNLSSVGLFLEYVREHGGAYRVMNRDGKLQDDEPFDGARHANHDDAKKRMDRDRKFQDVQLEPDYRMSKEEFHDIYRAHCTATHTKFPLEVQAFVQEMNRELGDNCPFDKIKSGSIKWFLKREVLKSGHIRLVGGRS